MKYHCTQCSATQWRGVIAEKGVNLWTIVLHGPGAVISCIAAESLLTYLGIEAHVPSLFAGVTVAAIVFSFYASLVLIPEYFLVTRRGCAACGERGLEWVPAWYSPIASAIASGNLYALRSQRGDYTIVKVLVVDDIAVHLRTYANRFSECPEQVNSSDLSLGSLGDPAGFGIGHFPLSRASFEREEKKLVGRETVSYEELSGYLIWSGEHSIDENAGGPDGLPSG
ncbi:MAG: hypothetical protein AB7O26_13155 [Planctomycetaceae bacterium]